MSFIRHLLHNDDATDTTATTSDSTSTGMNMGSSGADVPYTGTGMGVDTFTTSWQGMSLIFPTWVLNDTRDYCFTLLGVFFIAMAFELLGSCHRMFSLKFNCANATHHMVQQKQQQGKSLNDSIDTLSQDLDTNYLMSHDTPYTWSQQIFCGILHVIKAFISFFLMVMFMTLDVGIVLMLLAGLFAGFVLFHPSNSVGSDGSTGIFGLNAGTLYSSARSTYQSLFNHTYTEKTTLKRWGNIRHKLFGWMNKPLRYVPSWSVGEAIVAFTFIAINIGVMIPTLINLGAPNDCPGYANDDSTCNTWNTVMLQVDKLGLLGCGDAIIALIPVTRNSIVLLLTGIPYERALRWHRFVSYITLLAFTLHGIAAIWYYSLKQSLIELTYANPNDGFGDCALFGLIAWGAFVIATLTSFDFVRRWSYKVFLYTHIPMFLVFIGIGCAHKPLQIPWFLIIPTFFWAIDRMIRAASVLEPTLLLSMKPVTSDVTEIVFLKSHFHYVAGQYIFISVDTLGSLNAHPVSIASAPHELYIRLYVRANKLKPNSWSNRLHELATQIQNGMAKNPTVYVEGPYGSTDPHADFQRNVTLIAGGIGITNIRSLLYDITHHSHTQQVTLVWCVKDVSLLTVLQEQSNNRLSSRSNSTDDTLIKPGTLASSVSNNKLEEVENLLDNVDDAMQVDVGPKTVLNSHVYLTNADFTPEQLAELQQHHTQHKLFCGKPKLNEYMNGESDIVICGPERMLQHTRQCYKLLLKNGHTCQYREDTFVM